MVDIKSSDPRIHLENIKVEEAVVLKRLITKEAELRILLSELKALRNMKEESFKLLSEEQDYELEEEVLRKEQEENVESIDELVEDVRVVRQEEENKPYQTNTPAQPNYNIAPEEQQNNMFLASSSQSITEMYNIGQKENPTQEDIKRVFEITGAAIKSSDLYTSSPLVREQIQNTLDASKTIFENRPDLIQEYKPSSPTSPVNEFLQTLKKSSVTDYKL